MVTDWIGSSAFSKLHTNDKVEIILQKEFDQWDNPKSQHVKLCDKLHKSSTVEHQ